MRSFVRDPVFPVHNCTLVVVEGAVSTLNLSFTESRNYFKYYAVDVDGVIMTQRCSIDRYSSYFKTEHILIRK
jgi:hypothetical protein